MPDITMCNGVGCSMADTCYRHTATPNTNQSYFHVEPLSNDGSCDFYQPDRVESKNNWWEIFGKWIRSTSNHTAGDLISWLENNYNIPEDKEK